MMNNVHGFVLTGEVTKVWEVVTKKDGTKTKIKRLVLTAKIENNQGVRYTAYDVMAMENDSVPSAVLGEVVSVPVNINLRESEGNRPAQMSIWLQRLPVGGVNK